MVSDIQFPVFAANEEGKLLILPKGMEFLLPMDKYAPSVGTRLHGDQQVAKQPRHELCCWQI